MNFDRSQIVNFSYSYQMGKTFRNRLAGAVGNNWLFSGITNLTSGGNFQTGVSFSPSFSLQSRSRQQRVKLGINTEFVQAGLFDRARKITSQPTKPGLHLTSRIMEPQVSP